MPPVAGVWRVAPADARTRRPCAAVAPRRRSQRKTVCTRARSPSPPLSYCTYVASPDGGGGVWRAEVLSRARDVRLSSGSGVRAPSPSVRRRGARGRPATVGERLRGFTHTLSSWDALALVLAHARPRTSLDPSWGAAGPGRPAARPRAASPQDSSLTRPRAASSQDGLLAWPRAIYVPGQPPARPRAAACPMTGTARPRTAEAVR